MPDFTKARDEAVQRLQELIRIDTSNPPGNESKVAEYLKAILDREGIPSEIVALDPARGNLIARLKGNGRKKPLLLMAHTDVVGVERDKWTFEPFSGELKDGYVYGRGAQDNKDDVAAFLQVLLLLHRNKVPLDRDVIFLAEAGEEGTTRFGIDFVVEKHWPKIEAEFALNEGGGTNVRDGKVLYVGIGAAEKIPRRFRLVAKGFSGHGSVPRMDNPIFHLATAIHKITEYLPPMKLNEVTRVFFQRRAKIGTAEEAHILTHLEDPVEGPKVQEQLRRSTNRSWLTWNSMLRSSITPTIIKGGFRNNVIPAEAEATFDLRAVPDENVDELMATLRRIINDPTVEIQPEATYRNPSAPSTLGSELYQALERTQVAVYPEAITLPQMSTGATDSAQLRAKGVLAYGVGVPSTDQDAEGVHAHNERVSVEGMGRHIEFIYRAVVQVVAAK